MSILSSVTILVPVTSILLIAAQSPYLSPSAFPSKSHSFLISHTLSSFSSFRIYILPSLPFLLSGVLEFDYISTSAPCTEVTPITDTDLNGLLLVRNIRTAKEGLSRKVELDISRYVKYPSTKRGYHNYAITDQNSGQQYKS